MNIKNFINANCAEYGAKEFYESVKNDKDKWVDAVYESFIDTVYELIPMDIPNTIEEVAKLLDGNIYRDELYNDKKINIIELCKSRNWVIAYPYSDDNLELAGLFNEEFGAWDGTIIKFVKKGEFFVAIDLDYNGPDNALYRKSTCDQFVDMPEYEVKEIKRDTNNFKNFDGVLIEAVWDPASTDAAWEIRCVGAPTAKFRIMEDDSTVFAECLVIDMSKALIK